MRGFIYKAMRMTVLAVAAAGLVLGAAWGVDALRGGYYMRQAGLEPPGGEDSRPCVVCSIHPVSELVRMVAGDSADIITLLPPGADPHTFELKPSQAVKLRKASLVAVVGGGVDSFVDGLLQASGAACPVVRLLETVPSADRLAADGGAAPDPHIWLDPVIVRAHLLPALASGLTAADPAGGQELATRLQAACVELDGLHEWVTAQVGAVQGKPLITMHPAWAYFGRRYGLETYSVLAHHGGEPTPRHLEELLGIAQGRGIKVLFRERQVAGSALDVLVKRGGGDVMLLDPLGGPDLPGYDTYPSLIRSNVETIVRGLTLP